MKVGLDKKIGAQKLEYRRPVVDDVNVSVEISSVQKLQMVPDTSSPCPYGRR